ncbi:DNA-binding response OmpR family regulator [Krasilnikovia cinnamomea]|uniref:DNA-binding response OmpR family regulator n=1 Tax=Krasilnikovia cinnamomea TaxID=349313 RepID=A0A4Q7ZEX3_9ACTN|nr:response regulator transcription factor [Krasilnikovia cinnamomea]RZU48673.1 DNA-binding response OmpR family regulator [Krasilnikovia cinnamomea]
MALILLVEDDRIITAALRRTLTDAGHVVQAVSRAREALDILADHPPTLILLDLGLPDMDGTDALRMIRAVSDVPVVVATARKSENAIIHLLHAGADDYVTKPFSGEHILARIDAVLRRYGSSAADEGSTITVGPLVIARSERSVSMNGEPIKLTRREYDVLTYLAERVGHVVSRQELMTEVWRQPRIGEEQTIDVHLSWLRRKLGETAAEPRMLRTVRGVGVMMVDPG